MGDAAANEAVIQAWIDQADPQVVSADDGQRPGEFIVTVPGERKLKTSISLLAGQRSISATAFVMRHPDENAEDVFRWMLRRNVRLPGVAFAIDTNDDVYVRGRVLTQAATVDTVDELVGAIAITADESFNELLALGFLSSMQVEWDWRISRGESTANLAAFSHLLDRDNSK